MIPISTTSQGDEAPTAKVLLVRSAAILGPPPSRRSPGYYRKADSRIEAQIRCRNVKRQRGPPEVGIFRAFRGSSAFGRERANAANISRDPPVKAAGRAYRFDQRPPSRRGKLTKCLPRRGASRSLAALKPGQSQARAVASTIELEKAERVRDAENLAAVRLNGAAQPPLRRFIALLYEHVPPADVAQRSPDDLCCAALALWQFASHREPGRAKVRVYNPTLETDGWSSTRTIVEIVNDDMPFLVDSVTAAVNEGGREVRLVIHPILNVARDAKGTLLGLDPPKSGFTNPGCKSRSPASLTPPSGLRSPPNSTRY